MGMETIKPGPRSRGAGRSGRGEPAGNCVQETSPLELQYFNIGGDTAHLIDRPKLDIPSKIPTSIGSITRFRYTYPVFF